MFKIDNPYQTIIATNNDVLLKPIVRKDVDHILFCSGGGIQACFFTMGAIKCLIENNEFINKFDIITSTSGSVIPCLLIEQCYKNNLVGRKNWYKKYVMNRIHKFFKTNYVLNIIEEMIHLYNNENGNNAKELFLKTINDKFVLPNKKPTNANKNIKKPMFLYNYLDGNTLKESNDMSDLKHNKYKYALTLLRSALPFTICQKTPSFDGGLANNCVSTSVLNNYNPKKATIISIDNSYFYKKYKQKSLFEMLNVLFFNYGTISDINSVNFSSDLLNEDNTTLITISNQLQPSKNRIHKDVFVDWDKQKTFIDNYSPFLYDMFIIIENEGYIQTHTQLKNKTKQLKEKKIPNPEVYNRDIVFKTIPRHKYS